MRWLGMDGCSVVYRVVCVVSCSMLPLAAQRLGVHVLVIKAALTAGVLQVDHSKRKRQCTATDPLQDDEQLPTGPSTRVCMTTTH